MIVNIQSRFYFLPILWKLLSNERKKQFLVLQLYSLLAAFAEVANLGTLIPFLNSLANPTENNLNFLRKSSFGLLYSGSHYTFFLACIFLSAVIASTFLRVNNIKRQFKLVSNIATDISSITFEHIIHKPYLWHLNQHSGKVLGLISKDADQVTYIYQGIVTINVNIMLISIVGLALIFISPALTCITISCLALIYIVVFRFSKSKLRVFGETASQSTKQSLRTAQEAFSGIREIIIDDKPDIFVRSFRHHVHNFRDSAANINIYSQTPRFLIEGFFVSFLSIVAIVLSLSEYGLTPFLSVLVALALGSYRLLQPLQQCFASVNAIISSLPSLEQIIDIISPVNDNLGQTESVNLTLSPLTAQKPIVNIKNLWFRYTQESPYVLSDINLTINRGDKVAFVGPTGSGKSTIIDIISGLILPTEGQILLSLDKPEGIIEDISIRDWQLTLSHVPQSIYIADDTILNNIAFGVENSHIDFNHAVKCAEHALVHEFIQSLSSGYMTKVGESGGFISGGQRQRLALARALYKKPDILILDEATSALDLITECNLVRSLETINHDLTIISVAHRLDSIKNYDCIYYLVNGKITDFGSFSYLYDNHLFFRSYDH